MITASEIGDKTFFITAILAATNSRLIVFLGSMAGLTANNILSIILGTFTVNLPPTLMHYTSVTLFMIFGLKMIYEGFVMGESDCLHEYEEVKRMINQNEDTNDKKSRFIGKLFGKKAIVFLQVFSIIFFAEVGDKAQLSAIMLATRENIYGVALGSFVGFFISNAIAILASRTLLKQISIKKVANSFWNSFLASSSLITASELGDKTFFITSIMSIQKPRIAVFLGALSAMAVMNILSICLGILTTAISPLIIHYISVILFTIFGLKMVYDGIIMTEEESLSEYEEAQKVVAENKNIDGNVSNLFGQNYLVFIQVFSLIFFAEWGDKSQLSTILLAAQEGVWAVGIGAFVGYFICNAIAVLGSRVIAKIISVKKITIFGGFVFIACSLLKLAS
ncbi:hypothetical protein RDWZM_006148 [Blomia tropicalis]|uniref:GDT1 family protein n=1 Tax=Blomia tropicalis TaxID=40697 RepID=A0A9Q0M6K2_BLOTA|nr:hypothetical protein RDWZM_006148 [Blomia tropicalis]